jgi:hypothetical protein
VNKRMSFPRHGRRSTTRRHGPRRKRYLLVTAGTVTERDYFKSLQELFDVVIDVEATAKSPVELAKRAARLYRSDVKEHNRTQRPDLRSGAHLIPPWTDMPKVLEQLERDTKKHIV